MRLAELCRCEAASFFARLARFEGLLRSLGRPFSEEISGMDKGCETKDVGESSWGFDEVRLDCERRGEV